MRKTEINAYYKMLRLFFELNNHNNNPTSIKIPVLKFLDGFHKFWVKYYSKEFRLKVPPTIKK